MQQLSSDTAKYFSFNYKDDVYFIDGLLSIQAGQNPRVIDGLLKTYLPTGKRGTE